MMTSLVASESRAVACAAGNQRCRPVPRHPTPASRSKRPPRLNRTVVFFSRAQPNATPKYSLTKPPSTFNHYTDFNIYFERPTLFEIFQQASPFRQNQNRPSWESGVGLATTYGLMHHMSLSTPTDRFALNRRRGGRKLQPCRGDGRCRTPQVRRRGGRR